MCRNPMDIVFDLLNDGPDTRTSLRERSGLGDEEFKTAIAEWQEMGFIKITEKKDTQYLQLSIPEELAPALSDCAWAAPSACAADDAVALPAG